MSGVAKPPVDDAESFRLIPSKPSSKIPVKCAARALLIASPLSQRRSVRCRSDPVTVFSFEFGAPRRTWLSSCKGRVITEVGGDPYWRLRHLSPGLGQPWPAHFFSLCARRAWNSMSSAGSRKAPLAYRLWAGANTARRPWLLSFTHVKDYAGALSARLRECLKSCLILRLRAKPLQRESHESTSISGRGQRACGLRALPGS
jgi:hypothetical protein